MSLDQALPQAALAPEPPLDSPHLSAIALVVVPQQVQQPVQGQDPEFGELGMPRLAGLAAGDAAGDHDIAEKLGIGHGGYGT